MSEAWKPPVKIEELFSSTDGNQFSTVNRATSGSRGNVSLPVGKSPINLYSLATPNGQKVGILLEELEIDYDAHVINIGSDALDQFGSGFVEINPNSKIPALVDSDGPLGNKVNIFESCSILYYLAEKYQKFYPSDPLKRIEIRNWIFWQHGGQGPLSGQFGHFMVYAPQNLVETRNYGVARYGMEVKRLLHVLDTHLKGRTFIVGEEYTIADIACFPWAHQLLKGYVHSSGIGGDSFLSFTESYPNVVSWIERIKQRPATLRGMTVCSKGLGKPWLQDGKL